MTDEKVGPTPRPWKWHHRSEDQEHEGSVYSEQREGMAYAVAIMPRYQSREQWEVDAPLLASAPELHKALAGIKWQSCDKDNMEFSARITCYQMDAIRAALAAVKEGE